MNFSRCYPAVLILLLTGSIAQGSASEPGQAVSIANAAEAAPLADDADRPKAAYPYFTRPSYEGRDYNTWQDATGPDIGEVQVDHSRLPSRVDNSARPEFPPVYRQKWGACGQFAAAASVFTYEMNVADGKVADSDATRFPAHFSWNMMNRAKNVGSEAYHGWEVAKHVGLPNAKTYGGVRLNKIGVWPNGYDTWRDAMTQRVAGYRYGPVMTVAQLNEARGWLYDRNQPEQGKDVKGGVLAIDGRMGEMPKVTVTLPKGQYAEGQDLWTKWGPSGYGHGMACVGYDDQVGYDLNGDGKITNDIDITGDGQVTLADWERGAYIIVNSWGAKWSKDGRIYLLYSAMVDKDWKRGNYLGRIEVKRHTPRMTLRLKLACDDRTDLRMTIGLAGSANADAAEHEYKPHVFNGWKLFGRSNAGHVPMAGPGDNTPIEVGVDLTKLLESLGNDADGKGRLFLALGRADRSEAIGQLHEAAVRFYDEQGELVREVPLPIQDGAFGERTLQLDTALSDLPS